MTVEATNVHCVRKAIAELDREDLEQAFVAIYMGAAIYAYEKGEPIIFHVGHFGIGKEEADDMDTILEAVRLRALQEFISIQEGN